MPVPRPLLLAASILLLAAPAATAATPAGAAERSTCRELRGIDLAPARSVKLVRRAGAGVVRLESCSVPDGRVRTIGSGSAPSGNFTQELTLRQVAGAFAVVTTAPSDQYGDGEFTTLVNLRTGASRTVAEFQHQGGETPDLDIGSTVPAVFATVGGRVTAALLEPATQTVRIVARARDGRERTLDRAPLADLAPTSLALTGSTVTWTRGSVPRSAPLPKR